MMEAETRVAEDAARAAGAAALEFYGTSRSHTKADDSPVTAADHAANDVILARLRDAFPDDAILSEESRDTYDRLDAHRVWIVDPLDGTKEFLAQNGEFSVMIGLVVGGDPVLGVVYRPDGDVLYSATRDGGAWVVQDGERTRLQVAAADPSGLRVVESRSHGDPLLDRMREALGVTDVQPCGSVGVKCTRIAEARRDLYIHPVPYLKEWDTCAPEVLVREAGGEVTDCRGERLTYNKPEPTQPHGIVACAGGCLETVLATVRPIYEEGRESAA